MGIFIRNHLPNDLHADEKAQGWRLLWDGQSTRGWRSARGQGFPAAGWSIANGELAVRSRGGGGDIMTDDLLTARDTDDVYETIERMRKLYEYRSRRFAATPCSSTSV